MQDLLLPQPERLPPPGSDEFNLVPIEPSGIPVEECSLVLCAMGIEHRFDQNHSHIYIMEKDLAEAQLQLRLYYNENSQGQEQAYLPEFQKTSPLPTLFPCFAMIYLYMATGPWQADNPWFSKGASDSSAMLQQDQWYRCLTSLTLHADPAHLMGNMIIGGLLIHFLCGHIGFGAAWLLVLLSGAMGNIINIVLHPPTHLSVGLSTGIFGVVGVLTGMQLFRDLTGKRSRVLLSLGAGLSLLALLGSSDGRTDLGAHLFGLLSGIGLGLVYNFSPLNHLLRSSPPAQLWCYTLSLASVIYAWHLAWR